MLVVVKTHPDRGNYGAGNYPNAPDLIDE